MSEAQTDPQIGIRLNGEGLAIASPATVATLIALRQPKPPFAVELNKELVQRGQYDTTKLNQGDQVEIVTLVGGG
ncbi:MAG: sulfur carrier protein ThiS [Planctomycetota bacterium]